MGDNPLVPFGQLLGKGSSESSQPIYQGVWREWEITLQIDHKGSRLLGDSRLATRRTESRRWFLKATVDGVFFQRLCLALEKIGVTPHGSAQNAPAVFRYVAYDSPPLGRLPWIEFELEAFDLRPVGQKQLNQLDENYFLEGYD
jgi:hypothetical protein